jgi:hypothetical protein
MKEFPHKSATNYAKAAIAARLREGVGEKWGSADFFIN